VGCGIVIGWKYIKIRVYQVFPVTDPVIGMGQGPANEREMIVLEFRKGIQPYFIVLVGSEIRVAFLHVTYSTVIIILGVADLALKITVVPVVIVVGCLQTRVTGFAVRQLCISISLIHRLAVTV
jgi:hypothetical protein